MQSTQCILLVYSLHYSVDHQCEHSSSYLETKPALPPSNIENQTWFSFTGNTLKWAKLLCMASGVYCLQSTIGFLCHSHEFFAIHVNDYFFRTSLYTVYTLQRMVCVAWFTVHSLYRFSSQLPMYSLQCRGNSEYWAFKVFQTYSS